MNSKSFNTTSSSNNSQKNNRSKTAASKTPQLPTKSNWTDPEAQQEAERYINPIPSRTLISQIIKESSYPQTHVSLVQHFNLTDVDAIQALDRRLKAMVRDHQLIASDHQIPEYRILSEDDLLTGKIKILPNGHGLVIVNNDTELSLGEKELAQVFNGDTVQVRTSGTDRRGNLMARIVNITKRNQQEFIGHLIKEDNEYYFRLNPPNQHQPIAMEPEQIVAAGLKEGDYSRIAINDWPTRQEYANAHIVKPLANFADTKLIIPSTLLDMDIPHEFSDQVLKEAEKYKEPAAKDIKGRVDLRSLPLVTIDGEDSRDFDDAVYAEKRLGGGYRLIVAIADVSYYVKPGMALDEEAIDRSTSVYFPNHVVPMLPEKLSNGLCSLNPDVDRLCMVCDINLSRTGNVTGYQFYSAVMHSQARLTYGQVADYLDGKKEALPDNKAVRKSVDVLSSMYHTLLERRAERNAMEFESPETYMTFDENGAISEIKPRTRNDAHRLIEESMLLANVCAAEYALEKDLPILFRNHQAPDATKAGKVRDYVKMLGFTFPDQPTQADYQHIIEATRGRPDAETIHALLLRSMMQAFYGSENLGHYGLAYDSYTHFTSPIRRYPDLLLHRAIRAQIDQKKQPLTQTELEHLGEQTSMAERRADEASRNVSAWLKCHYMSQHLGDEFEGKISAVTEFGIFVTLTDQYVDGLVHVKNLGNDYFAFDPSIQSLVGRGKGQTFSLGDKVRIKVAGVNMDERKIDFELLNHQSAKKPAGPSITASDVPAVVSSQPPSTRPVQKVSKPAVTEEVFGKKKAQHSLDTANSSEDAANAKTKKVSGNKKSGKKLDKLKTSDVKKTKNKKQKKSAK